jgi:hypothetical protein
MITSPFEKLDDLGAEHRTTYFSEWVPELEARYG